MTVLVDILFRLAQLFSISSCFRAPAHLSHSSVLSSSQIITFITVTFFLPRFLLQSDSCSFSLMGHSLFDFTQLHQGSSFYSTQPSLGPLNLLWSLLAPTLYSCCHCQWNASFPFWHLELPFKIRFNVHVFLEPVITVLHNAGFMFAILIHPPVVWPLNLVQSMVPWTGPKDAPVLNLTI
jgi:hypothetical protein